MSGGASRQGVTVPHKCSACDGQGATPGIFYRLECMECHGVGWLPATGDLARELGAALTRALHQIDQLRRLLPPEEQAAYHDSPRDGLRGHYTGD